MLSTTHLHWEGEKKQNDVSRQSVAVPITLHGYAECKAAIHFKQRTIKQASKPATKLQKLKN